MLFALAAASASGIAVQVARSGWSWGNPTPQGNSLAAVDFLNGRGYAVGAAGTALRTDDGGATWAGLATGTAADLSRLQIVDPDTLVVLGGDGCALRRSADGGATFQKIFVVAEVNCPDKVQSFNFVDKNTGYLLLRDGSVLKTTDAGQSFSKQTAIPGTPASAVGGSAAPADLLFSDASSGIAFITPPGAGSQAYTTTDGGVSWKPFTGFDPSSVVNRLYRFDAKTIYGIGPNTLLRSTDGGQSFSKQAVGSGRNLTSIHCASASTCLITTDHGDLERTTDGGDTATTITTANVPLAAAAFASPTRAVGVGAVGQTVVSNDGGVNYVSIGGDIGGNFLRLRRGPVATTAFAPGAKGQIAKTTDGGVTWKVANVPTSSDILDTSWVDANNGFALDSRGGLFRTANAGDSWQTLSPGAGPPASAVLALPDGRTVLLVGPTGVKRAIGGGAFQSVAGKPVATAGLNNAELAGNAVVAWGAQSKNLLESTDGGASWRAIKLPQKKRTRLADVSFLNASVGYLLDTGERLWMTGNGGRGWHELPTIGTSAVQGMTFGTASSGFVAVHGFAGDFSGVYVLHTTNGGRSWIPQAISPGFLAGLLAPDATHGYALLGGGTPASGPAQRQLFFTGTGGSAGSPSTLRISAAPAKLTKKRLHRSHGAVTISGTLSGAVGGERIQVSARPLNGGAWSSVVATAGANGGSFSARFRIRSSEVFVAQWAGDSGRAGAGSQALTVKVR
jgi:photosystem II stability/assembly factor-like uncharacterized protein